ncbi:unnamed protein product [Urochloa decumbens]|uniref:AAA+ ATPase domain-containing protein n=1 Tax=Urochloa decumbens TaxID=240449 RepID=A0ABC9APK6_9POAL
MDLVTGAMGALPGKVLELLKEEYKLQSGVQEEVNFLSRELEVMHAALCKVAQVPPDKLDLPAKLWARDVREASYDMEDILDAFLVRVDGDPQPADTDRIQRRVSKQLAKLFGISKLKARHEIATAIVGIRKQLVDVAARHDRYRSDHLVANPPAAPASLDPRLKALYKSASHLFGIEEPREALIGMIMMMPQGKDPTANKIVSIVGSAGLGKTTLAKAAYDKINQKFDCCAFVPVGQNPVLKKVLKDILVDLTNDERKKYENDPDKKRYTGADLVQLEARDLIRELREFLERKRYFIVVDDIWDTEIWGYIEVAFTDSNNGSRIVTTSRNSEVSQKIGHQIYRINKLSDHNSRKLFYARISLGKRGDKGPDIDKLVEISDQILPKCHGVPLAIIAVASVLANKPRNEWPNVCKSIGFLVDGDNKNEEAMNMKKILSFSYYDLPCHLRTCMLYLSVFPEDHYVDKKMLIRRWIAEGLIPLPTEVGKGPFEVGEGYFHELVNRGLILPSHDRGHIVDGCRVHDLVLNLIRELSSQEDFVFVAESVEGLLSLPLAQLKVRRLTFANIWEKQHRSVKVNDIGEAQRRSFNAIYSNMLPSLDAFPHLRVLSLEYCSPKEGYLKPIGKLLHLRYLGLTGTPIKTLPKEIEKLKRLQTLILENTGIEELPESLVKLTELVCLRADKKTRVPDWMGKLTSLVELVMYPGADDKFFVKELGKLRNLRVLTAFMELQDEEQARDLLDSLSKHEQILDIRMWYMGEQPWEAIEVTEVGAGHVLNHRNLLSVLELTALTFATMPLWINHQSLPNLCKLTLHLKILAPEDLENLGRLECLETLSLFVSKIPLAYEGVVICREGGFPNLVSFSYCFGVRSVIKFVTGAMPRLEHIDLVISVAHSVEYKVLAKDHGFGSFCSLQRVTASICYTGCWPAEVEEVEAALTNEVNNHPNRPMLSMARLNEHKMATTDLGMLSRQSMRELRFMGQHLYHWSRHKDLICESQEVYASWGQMGNIVPNDTKEVKSFLVQCMETIERAYNWQILRPGSYEIFSDKSWLTQTEQQPIERLFCRVPNDVQHVTERIAANQLAVVIFSTEYPRLTAMWEQLQAEHSLYMKEIQLSVRLTDEQLPLYVELITHNTLELLNTFDEMKRVPRFLHQCYDTMELAFHGRILWRTQLGDEDHRDYAQERQEFWELFKPILSIINVDLDHDVRQVKENIAVKEAVLEKLTVQYPRLAAMLEELKAELSSLPAAEAAGTTDTIANNVTEETEEPVHCLSDQ